jgi:hypothetical protein
MCQAGACIFARQHGIIMLAIKYHEEDGSCPDPSVLFSALLEDHQEHSRSTQIFSVELYPAIIRPSGALFQMKICKLHQKL